jgi:hypothetical protein
MFHDTHMGPFSPNHTLAEAEDFSHSHDSRGKNVASEGGGLIGLCFRGTLLEALTQTSGLGGKNGYHTHDTSRSSDNAKSLNYSD